MDRREGGEVVTWNYNLILLIPCTWELGFKVFFIHGALDVQTYGAPGPQMACVFIPPFVNRKYQFDDVLFNPRWQD